MKFGVVNKSTTLNRFVLHTLQHNITHLAVITRKSNIKLVFVIGGGKLEKSRKGKRAVNFWAVSRQIFAYPGLGSFSFFPSLENFYI